MRVGLQGILSLKERLDDLFERYKERMGDRIKEWNNKRTIFEEFEREIFESSTINQGDINDESTESIIEELKKYQIV